MKYSIYLIALTSFAFTQGAHATACTEEQRANKCISLLKYSIGSQILKEWSPPSYYRCVELNDFKKECGSEKVEVAKEVGEQPERDFNDKSAD